MNNKNLNVSEVIELKVVERKLDKVYVKFPSLEVLVEMTINYLLQLIKLGKYKITMSPNVSLS